ncbi:hypothetical protein [Streptomyces sp. NPDC004232]|uniref:hypothetical protein n=1 Tax=unclassified Streptomyces TaxID=2593676 RepID=UPI001DA4C60D|nr:hypothetical protein [Streptomyces sp. tea 10]
MRTPPSRPLFGLWLAVAAATVITVIGGLATLFGVMTTLLFTGTADAATWGVAGGIVALALGLGLERLAMRRPHFMRAPRALQHTQQPGDVEL